MQCAKQRTLCRKLIFVNIQEMLSQAELADDKILYTLLTKVKGIPVNILQHSH